MLMSRNYPPSAALRPLITQHHIISDDMPDDSQPTDQVLSEYAFVGIGQSGDCAIEVKPGIWQRSPDAVLLGSHSRAMRVRVKGPFRMAGIVIRPSGWRALFPAPAHEFADDVAPLAEIWGDAVKRLTERMPGLHSDQQIVDAMEAELKIQLSRIGSWCADPPMQAFEQIARHDCTRQVKDVAAELDLSERQFERQCLTSFGHTPKLVLRRSRFLDVAAVIRDMGSQSDEDSADLRYFDQSHRNRDFRRFIGMTPQTFAQTPTPLFTASLKLRLEHRVEIDRNRGEATGANDLRC